MIHIPLKKYVSHCFAFFFHSTTCIDMFKMISWPQYLGAVAVLLVLYYAFVAVAYYRAELMGLVSGKGKAAGPLAQPTPAPSTLLGKAPLIPKAAVVLPVSASTPPATEATDAEEETPELEQQPVEAPTAQVEAPLIELPDPTSSTISQNETINVEDSDIEKTISFIEADSNDLLSVGEGSAETTTEEFDGDFTVGVAQLSDYFDRAAEGEITQEQLVEEVPALENTDLLVAFYKNSKKSAHALTSALYAEEATTTID
ncbi:hypothetical protein [Hymenobacter sp. GOD-10R]|uniref:hypothetical protein n=1 Tax=Hymenobacter sp. GOD-10R TaxID=3093922 RepID=UPI002D7706D3|nr:hypothetical protein [Hymenobacter sp. GOD-10R]WRQ31617.1 hypothetical protein SD425_27685 [Hymenobacter sp. GOD-10R]